MTASTGPTTAGPASAGPRPQLLTLAAILLGVSAVLALLLPLSLFTDRTYVGCSVAVGSANATPSATKGAPSPTPTGTATTSAQLQAQLNSCIDGTGPVSKANDSDTSRVLQRQLLAGVVPLILLGGLAFFAYRGVPLVRWFIVGLWVISNLYPLIPFSVLQLTGLFSGNLPGLFGGVFVLGVLTFTAAAVLVNLPPVVRYFNARRPVRAAAGGRGGGGRGGGAGGGGLLGGLFGPRPARAGGTATGTGRSSGSRVSMDKPAPGPPTPRAPKSKGPSSGGSGNTGRSKGKKRG